MNQHEVDIDAAQKMLEAVKEWLLQPEVQGKVTKATDDAENALLGMVLTGTLKGYWPDTPESNQFLLDKLRIAFQMGYYFSMGAAFVEQCDHNYFKFTFPGGYTHRCTKCGKDINATED